MKWKLPKSKFSYTLWRKGKQQNVLPFLNKEINKGWAGEKHGWLFGEDRLRTKSSVKKLKNTKKLLCVMFCKDHWIQKMGKWRTANENEYIGKEMVTLWRVNKIQKIFISSSLRNCNVQPRMQQDKASEIAYSWTLLGRTFNKTVISVITANLQRIKNEWNLWIFPPSNLRNSGFISLTWEKCKALQWILKERIHKSVEENKKHC